ncbi:MAG: phasin PhaH [Caulobacter sp.]
MVSLFTFLPDYSADKVEPETAPRVAVGAASPLWLMFGGAAAAGAAYWWWASRWREAVNLEALMALTPEPVAPALEAEAALDAPLEPVIEPVLEPVAEAVIDAVEAVMDAEETALTLGAEAVVEVVADMGEAAVEVIAEAPPEAVVAPDVVAYIVEDSVDDLTQLVGIGPKLAASLAELGVTRFSQIAAWSPDELASIDQLLNLKGRAERDAWIAQAKRFAAATDA